MVIFMKKSSFLKATLILMVGGFITKLLGMVIRIVTSRYLGVTGIGIHSLLMPTYSLFIALASFGFPIAISKLVAENKFSSQKLVASILPFSLVLDFILILLLVFNGHFIADNLLHNSLTFYGLIAIGLTLPFISISSLLRGYYFGKERMLIHVVSNVIEDIIRLFLLVIGIPFFMKFGVEFAVFFVIFSNIASEISSIIILIFGLPNKLVIDKKDFKPQKKYLSKVFSISIPTVASRLIGNIGYFLEPILFTTILLFKGFTNQDITLEYGVISGFVLPLILIPSFFTMAISQALIPTISKYLAIGKKRLAKKRFNQAIFISLFIGIIFTFIFELFPGQLLYLLYHNTDGIFYVRILAPICLLQYIQTPLASTLQAMDKSKEAFTSTLVGTVIKIFTLIIGCYFFNVWGLILSICLGIIYVTIIQYHKVKKFL